MENALDTIRRYDLAIYTKIYQLGYQNPLLYQFFLFFSRYGILIFSLSFIFLIWVKRINALICSGFALAIAGVIDLTIYIVWKRPRPYIAHADIASAVPDQSRVDISSFPSSHTYIAFAIATSIFLYGHRKLGTFLFVMAILVAISRIGVGLHYPSDIIGGAMLGIFSGIVAYYFTHKIEKYWE